jgi:hypothetical protein
MPHFMCSYTCMYMFCPYLSHLFSSCLHACTLLRYMMILGFMVFADTNSTKVFGMEMDAVMPAKIFDFVRNFGMMYWGVGIMTKND